MASSRGRRSSWLPLVSRSIDAYTAWIDSDPPDPLIDSASVSQLADLFKAVEKNNSDESLTLALCLALRLMPCRPLGDLKIPHLERDLCTILRAKLAEQLIRTLPDFREESLFHNSSLIKQSYRSSAIVLTGHFAHILRESSHTGAESRSGFHQTSTSNEASLILSTMETPSLHSMIDFPLPFNRPAPAQIGISHLAKMSSRDFFEDGEWNGVYSMSIG